VGEKDWPTAGKLAGVEGRGRQSPLRGAGRGGKKTFQQGNPRVAGENAPGDNSTLTPDYRRPMA